MDKNWRSRIAVAVDEGGMSQSLLDHSVDFIDGVGKGDGTMDEEQLLF